MKQKYNNLPLIIASEGFILHSFKQYFTRIWVEADLG